MYAMFFAKEGDAMNFRHEWKHEISYPDLLILRQRLKAIIEPDRHAVNGSYFIRSLYFDNAQDQALLEKLNGVNVREKFRIRFYNHDPTVIHLEKKSKWNSLGTKQTADLTREEAQAIADGSWDWMAGSDRPLVQELYVKMVHKGLRPKTIVDYIREPYTYAPGNVRVTLDYGIRTGLGSTDFLNPDCVTIPVPGDPIILEVKWDEFLPDLIRSAVQLDNRHAGAFSKYAACRIYG